MDQHDLFISYHRPDRESVEAVRGLLKARGISSFLDREHLVAGLPWPQALENALQSVGAVAVFLGPHGMGLWQKREMGFALDRQVREEKQDHAFPVIPVLLPRADPAPSFLFLNTWVDLRDDPGDSEMLAALVRAIRGEEAQSFDETGQVLLPYRALEVFHEEHAAFFCGRDAFSERLLDKVLSHRLTGVVGPSGSGKSSVVQAGLLPLLRRKSSPAWDAAIFTPGARPCHHLATALLPFLEPDSSEVDRQIEAEKLGDALAKAQVRLETIIRRLLEKSKGTDRLLLVVDQFEELFTTVPENQRQPFIQTLLHAMEQAPLTLVLTLRADFFGDALNLSRELSDALERGQINLGPMRREELEQAIVIPAQRVGLRFEGRLVKRILDEVGNEPGSLPLLEFALTELWERREGRQMTHAALDEINGVTGALTQRADNEFAKLTPAQQKAARQLFSQLVRVARPEEGAEDTRQRAALAKLGADVRGVAKELTQARLLVIGSEGLSAGDDSDQGETSADASGVTASAGTKRNTVEVAHEALIREWKRLRIWLNEDREFLLWQQRLQTTVDDWERTNDSSVLLRGSQLAEAKRWNTGYADELSKPQKNFIQASKTRRFWAGVRITALAGMFAAMSLASVGFFTWIGAEQIRPQVGLWLLLYRFNVYTLQPEMVEVPAGNFMMGSPEPQGPLADPDARSDEVPRHEVEIARPFKIGKYEVTFDEYEVFVRSAGYEGGQPPSSENWGRGWRPVINVSRNDAVEYAKWLSEQTEKRYRLPTEAEWEYAARAGTESKYWWGDDIKQDGEVWANCDGCGSEWDSMQTAPVGQFPANGFGLHDTSGNVWEWVQDCWHDNYDNAPTEGGKPWREENGGDCGRRVLRGGAWSSLPGGLRSAARFGFNPGNWGNFVDFRLAQDL